MQIQCRSNADPMILIALALTAAHNPGKVWRINFGHIITVTRGFRHGPTPEAGDIKRDAMSDWGSYEITHLLSALREPKGHHKH